MNKDKVAGAAKHVKGAVEEAAGKMSGDRKLQAEGKVDKAKGNLQSAAGKLKDAQK